MSYPVVRFDIYIQVSLSRATGSVNIPSMAKREEMPEGWQEAACMRRFSPSESRATSISLTCMGGGKGVL